MTKNQRQHLISKLLETQAVTSQGQLVNLLADQGVEATQTTVSRDLEDLGAVKVRLPGGETAYALPELPVHQIAPEDHLRGRFVTGDDGSYGFLTVRPTPYPIPHDGPVGHMLAATGRHPWRPAHIHVIVRAAGHRPVTTHIFDADSEHIDSDAVFAVKPSLLRELTPRPAGDPGRPPGLSDHTGRWWSLASDFVLAPGSPAG